MTAARVHSFESFGAADGPGVRFVVFLQGCRMRCRYCHNPDTWEVDAGEEFDADQVLARALRFRDYWGEEGGITVSGGEPLLQMQFLTELFEKAHASGIHTTIDTAAEPFCDDAQWMADFERLMSVTDLVLLDIKHIDSLRHKRLTGKGNDNVLECARHLDRIGKPVWIRHVLVPGWTDEDVCLTQLRAFISTLSNVQRVEVLPFHNMAAFKWERLGIKYALKDCAAPDRARIDNARRILGAV